MKKLIHIAIAVAFYTVFLCVFVCDTDIVYAEALFAGNNETIEITEQENSEEEVQNGICFHAPSGYFMLYENGVANKIKGWHKLPDGAQVYVSGGGYITAKLTKSGDVRRYYNYNKSSKSFERTKSCWKKIGNVSYYFNKSGVSTRMYNHSNNKLFLCKNKKMLAAPSGIYLMSNGRYFCFNKRGMRITKKGWRKLNKTTKVYISKKGYVTYKYVKKSGKEKCYKYSASAKRWKLLKKSWLKISGKYYYFGSNGNMQKNTMVGSENKGYYYVDKSGVRVTSKEIRLAVKFVTKYTKSNWSAEKKMKVCYDSLWKNYSYRRYYGQPSSAVMSEYACDILTNGCGNCFRYAAAYACIATVLGYDARVNYGQIEALSGGMTPHGWTEVYIDGEWLMCDPNMQRSYPHINVYMKKRNEYVYEFTVSGWYGITAKNGKVIWK